MEQEPSSFERVVTNRTVRVIGDMHGDGRAFTESADQREKKLANPDKKTTPLIMLGDVIDRGPESVEIIQNLLKRRYAIFIAGNHEKIAFDAYLAFTNGDAPEKKTAALRNWLNNGGGKTLNAAQWFEEKYRNQDLDSTSSSVDDLAAQISLEDATNFRFFFEDALLPYIRKTKLMHQMDSWLFVHAGVDEATAEWINREGIEGVNTAWETYLSNGSQLEGFKTLEQKHVWDQKKRAVTHFGGPLWIRRHEKMDLERIGKITAILNGKGISSMAVGHNPQADLFKFPERWDPKQLALWRIDRGAGDPWLSSNPIPPYGVLTIPDTTKRDAILRYSIECENPENPREAWQENAVTRWDGATLSHTQTRP